MNATELQFRIVGEGGEARRLAFHRRRATRGGQAGVIWLGGFKSDMTSTKASELDALSAAAGRAYLRFDYSGHGASEGDFTEGTVTRWLEEALAMILTESEGPQVIVGSSMGGYLALLIARELARLSETARLQGFVLIAPAVDFTEALIWASLPEAAREAIMTQGEWRVASAYSPEPTVFTRALIEDGRRRLLFGGEIRSYAPVRILQGMRDRDVPYAQALKLVEHMPSDSVTLTLIRDGEHRLSRPQDIALLKEAVEGMA